MELLTKMSQKAQKKRPKKAAGKKAVSAKAKPPPPLAVAKQAFAAPASHDESTKERANTHGPKTNQSKSKLSDPARMAAASQSPTKSPAEAKGNPTSEAERTPALGKTDSLRARDGGNADVLTRRTGGAENSPAKKVIGSLDGSLDGSHASGAGDDMYTTKAGPLTMRRREQPIMSPLRNDEAMDKVMHKAVAHARPRAPWMETLSKKLPGVLTRDSAREVQNAPTELPVYEKSKADMDLIMRAYASCSLFEGLPPGVPQKLALAMVEMSVAPNVDIVEEGQSGDESFYIIAEGEVSVLQRPDISTAEALGMSPTETKSGSKTGAGHERVIRTLKTGESFGEVSLLYNTERTATVRAHSSGPCRVFKLIREHYMRAQMNAQEAQSRERRKLVSGVDMLCSLESELFDRVVDMLESETRCAGEIIFEKGDFGDKLYIIEAGEVSIMDNGEEKRRCRVGDYFGEMALFNDVPNRNATAVVAPGTTALQLLYLERGHFESILGPLKIALHAATLSRIPFFAPLSDEQIGDLAQSLQLRKFSAGATIIKAGMLDNALYIVDTGEVEEESSAQFSQSRLQSKSSFKMFKPASPSHDYGQKVVRRMLHKGDYFGEAALLTAEPGGLTVKSLGFSSVLSLSKVEIEKKVGSLEQVQQAWRRNAIEGWVKHTMKENPDTAVSSADIEVIIEELEVKCCKAGEVLADSNENPGGVFVGLVMSGCVAVISKLHRAWQGSYNAKTVGDAMRERKHPLAAGGSFERRSQLAGMQRKRLITEGPAELPGKSATAEKLFGDDAKDGDNDRVEIKLVAAAAAVLLVPPQDPSPELHHALTTLHESGRVEMTAVGILSGDGTQVRSALKMRRGSAPLPGSVNDNHDNKSDGSISNRNSPNRVKHQTQENASGRVGDKKLAHSLDRSETRDASGAIRVDPRSLKIIKAVGKGGFSRVFHVSCDSKRSGESRTRREFALKVVPIWHLVKNRVEHTVRHERDVMHSVNHPAIVRLHSAFKAHDHIYFVMDLVKGLDFYWCMQNYEISEKGAKFYISQVVMMLEYLHSRTIAYRDIKPENLIIARDGYLRLIDFGLSKFLGPGERTYTFCGTPLYLAPEVYGSGGHNRAVDFWALGVLLFEVTSGKLPWEAKTEVELRSKVVNGTLRFPMQGTNFSPQLKQFITGLLEKNPNKRLGMLKEGIRGLKRAAWLQNVDWKGLEARKLEPPFRPELDVNPEMQDRVRVDDADKELVPPSSRECPKYGEYFPDF